MHGNFVKLVKFRCIYIYYSGLLFVILISTKIDLRWSAIRVFPKVGSANRIYIWTTLRNGSAARSAVDFWKSKKSRIYGTSDLSISYEINNQYSINRQMWSWSVRESDLCERGCVRESPICAREADWLSNPPGQSCTSHPRISQPLSQRSHDFVGESDLWNQ